VTIVKDTAPIAVSIAPGAFPNGWVYLFGPVGGALIAGLLWNHLFLARRC